MILGLGVFAVSIFFIPLASGATLMSALFLAVQQLGDGFLVVYETNQVTLRQTLVSERVLGRVNATFQFLNLGAILIASLLAGSAAELFGVRPILIVGCGCTVLTALLLAASPLRTCKSGHALARR